MAMVFKTKDGYIRVPGPQMRDAVDKIIEKERRRMNCVIRRILDE